MWNLKHVERVLLLFLFYIIFVARHNQRALYILELVSYTITLMYVNEWCTCSDKAIDIIMREEIPAEINTI